MKKCFPFLKTCGSQLEYIDKKHSNLEYVPDEVIRNARSIEECFLDANQIKDLPKNFFRLSKIRVLTLSDNDLSYIPESIGNFCHLVELDISRNHIEEIHYNIKFCNELRTLDISNNPICRLPEGFSSLRNLTFLSLNDISLTELPNDFGNLSALERLELRDNCLKVLPNSFSRLQHLELIDLGGNEFHEFPRQLGLLSVLKILCMDNNELKNIPQDIGTLRNLQQLDVSENFLEEICQEIGNLQSLTDLVLSQNSLEAMPNSIGNLKELTVIKLDQNKLIALTSHIGSCVELQEMYLTDNQLTKLPGTMGKLSKLSHLNVDRNDLLGIPPELTRCSKLSIMSFRENRIRALPNEIGNMQNLHVLDVSSNQLDRLPLSIAQCPLKALWLSENQSQSIVKLQRDSDVSTGEEYLTCYLLPQWGADEDYNQENIIHPPEYRNSERISQALPSGAGDSDSVNLRIISSTSATDSKVRFTDDEQVPSNRMSKELPKTKHPKFDKKAVDGHIIPKDAHSTKEIKFSPSRSGSESEQVDSRLNGKLAQNRTKKTSGSESFDDSDSQGRSDKDKEAYELVYPHSLRRPAPPSMAPSLSVQIPVRSTNISDESRLRSHSDAGIRGSEIKPIAEEAGDKGLSVPSHSTSQSSTSSSSSNLIEIRERKEIEVVQPVIKPRKPKLNLKFNEASSHSNEIVSSSRNSREQGAYSSGGEEMDNIDRHVGFSDDIGDNEDSMDVKLIRSNTPHYNKKARIQETTDGGVKSEDVVKKIMEKLKYPTQPPSPNSNENNVPSPASNTDDVLSPVKMRPVESIQISPTFDQVVSASALARGSDVPAGLYKATSESEEINIIIQRSTEEPLGMSIAGGKGSTPYQPVFVSRVAETGAANRCGLRVNDKIVDVNGESMKDVSHSDAVVALKNAGNYINLWVLREVVVAPPPLSSSFIGSENGSFSYDQSCEDQIDVKFETIKCDLVRDESGLGFSIAGGKGSMKKDVCDQRWAFLESIYICKITKNGAADKCKMLQIGDKIIKINGIDISDARHDQAVVLLSGSEPVINLVVQRQIIVPKSSGDSLDKSGVSNITSPVFDYEDSSMGVSSLKDRETIKIVKSGGQLGLCICGGSDNYSHPFGLDEPGIFVSKIASSGAAKACGKLRVGDRIVKVNGQDVTKSTHDEAVFLILQAANELILEVVHEALPPGFRKLIITKEITEKLGIVINGGTDGICMNPDDPKDNGIFIIKILPNSAVYKDGQLKVGDRLLEVNGRTFMGVTCHVANKVLREVSIQMEVLICDGVSPENIDKIVNSSNNRLSNISVPDECSPTPNSSNWKYSPKSFNQSPHISTNKSTPHSHDNNNNSSDYTSQNSTSIASPDNEEHNLSFRSKRKFFEKEINNRK